MRKEKTMFTSYSLKTKFSAGWRNHSLKFYYTPDNKPKKPLYDSRRLSHAKSTLKHARKAYPQWEHKIVKTVTIIEDLNY